MLEIVTSEFPELVTVMDLVELVPVSMLPNARLLALNESVCVAAIPVPLNPMLFGLVGALLTIETEPLAAPAAAGLNTTLKLVDWLALRLIGRDKELVLNPLPLTFTCEMLSVPVPLFVT